MTDETTPILSVEMGRFAMMVAMTVRNAMEDFHCEHLTDEQMRQLNPIVRNAIATALHAFENYESSEPARKFMDFQHRCIPAYWEPPELLEGYVKFWRRKGDVTPGA